MEDSTIDTTRATAGAQDARSGGKTAVVVVHGMGEQRPMDTLWGLVEALWINDPQVGDSRQVYPKPDRMSDNFELRRITTVRSKLIGGKRVDFFELYWAHLMLENKIGQVFGAVKRLLFRPRDQVPERLVAVWNFGRWAVLALLVLYLVALAVTAVAFRNSPGGPAGWLLVAGVAGWLVLLLMRMAGRGWIGPVAGDAARYLSPDPGNVAARQAIRESAVRLIEKLHANPDYDRTIIVGHSLGTIVAYDALTFSWGRIDQKDFQAAHNASPDLMEALTRLESAAAALAAADPAACGPLRCVYREAQRAYLELLATCKRADGVTTLWQVSDFVSTASPLSKADVLMAADEKGWAKRRELRDAPICPPQFEDEQRFSYPAKASVRTPHHAAVFGPTCWTNVYFETERIVLGDVIAGPVRALFGNGVVDVRLKRKGVFFRHLDYWKDPEAAEAHPWIRALRRAVNLRGQNEAALWGRQAAAEEIQADDLPPA